MWQRRREGGGKHSQEAAEGREGEIHQAKGSS